jgi:hypothetical protein
LKYGGSFLCPSGEQAAFLGINQSARGIAPKNKLGKHAGEAVQHTENEQKPTGLIRERAKSLLMTYEYGWLDFCHLG